MSQFVLTSLAEALKDERRMTGVECACFIGYTCVACKGEDALKLAETHQPRIAFFPGSFDPWTNGHMFLLRMGLSIFDNIIVVVAVNPNKTYLFESWERVNMIRDVVRKSLPPEMAYRVKVIETDSYVGEQAEKYGANYFLRGVRDAKDAAWELEVASINQKLFPKMQTVMLHAPSSISWMSSSSARKIAKDGQEGHLDELLHPEVEALTRLRFKQNEANPTP